MKRTLLLTFVPLAVVFLTSFRSPSQEGQGESQAAGHIFETNCAACHGVNLNKPVSPEYPKLAGQHADYVYWALRQYQMGNGNPHFGRNNPIMQAQVQSLSQSDMKDIAAYVESLSGDLVEKK